MDGTGFLKTVRVGGFDKKDVLAYVDELNSKIYALEAELDEKKALLENSDGGGQNNEKYEELLAADKAKITELQTNNESLKHQMQTMHDELNEKDKELEECKSQIAELEEQLQEAKNKAASVAGSNEASAMDLSNVFIEAQKTANTIVTQAKENARKMDEDAKKLANQVVDDANGKASTIVKNADEKAIKILSDAEDRSAEMRAASDKIRKEVEDEIAEIDENVVKLKEVLEMFSGESLARLKDAKAQIDSAQNALRRGRVPSGDSAAKPAPAPAPKPAPAPQPAPQPAPKPTAKPAFAGFDMSELESLTKAAEAEAAAESESELDASSISLSDM